MTEEHLRGRSWWELDPNEKPIPLVGPGALVDKQIQLDGPNVPEAAPISSRRFHEISIEHSSPSLSPPGQEEGRFRTGRGARIPRRLRLRGAEAPRVPLVLVAGCVAMFALGWRQGSAAAPQRVSGEPMSKVESSIVEQGTASRDLSVCIRESQPRMREVRRK